jgi:hypothetical protein
MIERVRPMHLTPAGSKKIQGGSPGGSEKGSHLPRCHRGDGWGKGIREQILSSTKHAKDHFQVERRECSLSGCFKMNHSRICESI